MRAVLPLVGFVAFIFPLSAADPSLESRIQPLAEKHKGKVAVAVKNLASGEGYALNADEVMPTASLIKLAIMVEAYRQADDKKTDLNKTLTLTKDEHTPSTNYTATFSLLSAATPITP